MSNKKTMTFIEAATYCLQIQLEIQSAALELLHFVEDYLSVHRGDQARQQPAIETNPTGNGRQK